MPLLPGKENVGKNIATEENAGKPKKQAVAIALNVARKSGADIPAKNDMTAPGGSNAYVPSQEKDQEVKYIKFEAALFDEHDGAEEGLDIDFSADVLQKICDACNSRIKDTNEFVPVTDGHTADDPDDHFQPDILGFATDFRVSTIGREKPRKAIYATLCIHPDKLEKAKNLPRRSIELWPDGVIDPVVLHGKSPVDSVALLGATRPARDLGRMVLKNSKGLRRYQYELKEPNMDHEEIVKRCIEALQSLPEMEYLRELMNHELESANAEELHKADAEHAHEGGEQAGSEKVEEKTLPDGGDELVEEEKLKMSHEQSKRRYAKLEADYQALQAKVEKIERTARINERKADLLQLEAEGINFDMVEEMETVADLEPVKYKKHLDTMRKRYAKAPIGVRVKPMNLPLDGVVESAIDTPKDVYSKVEKILSDRRSK